MAIKLPQAGEHAELELKNIKVPTGSETYNSYTSSGWKKYLFEKTQVEVKRKDGKVCFLNSEELYLDDSIEVEVGKTIKINCENLDVTKGRRSGSKISAKFLDVYGEGTIVQIFLFGLESGDYTIEESGFESTSSSHSASASSLEDLESLDKIPEALETTTSTSTTLKLIELMKRENKFNEYGISEEAFRKTITEKEIEDGYFFNDRGEISWGKVKRWVRRNEGKIKANEVDSAGGSTKPKCPQCNNEYSTSPIEHNRVNYCSETCKNDANKDKYTCDVCKNEFTDEPTTKDGKKCCVECKDKVGSSGTKNKGKDISKIRTDAISAINAELNSNPVLKNSDLEQKHQNWESEIKELDNETAINDYKNQVMAHIQTQKKKKQDEKKIEEDLERLQNQDATIEDKEKFLDDLKNKEGEESAEKNKEKVDNVKKEVARNDPVKYRDKVINDLPDKLTQNGLTKDELDAETNAEIEAIKQETDSDKIVERENKINQKIGQQGATKKITSLEKRVESALKNNDKAGIEKLKKEIIEFIESNNVYFQSKKEVAEKMLNRLKERVLLKDDKNNQTGNKGFFQPKVLIPVALGAVFLGVLAVMVIRSRRRKKK